MRLVLISLFVAIPAAAQPVTQPETCEVTIARAPDDVRATIAQWLAGETCTVPLEVRVVPTDGGLYLIARDGRGRVRERVVPDADSAGVLVASWAADDGLGPQPAIAEPERAPVANPWLVPHPGDRTPPIAPPSTIVPVEAADGAPVRRHTGGRWIGLSMLEGNDGMGGRATIDIVGRGPWTVGAALSATPFEVIVASAMIEPVFTTRYGVQPVAYLARTFGDGPWTMRTSLGAGVSYTRMSYDEMQTALTGYHSTDYLLPMAEASVLLGRDIGADWGFDVGAVTTIYGPSMHSANEPALGRTADLELAAGIRHRL